MKKTLFLILLLVAYFQIIQGVIVSTLTRSNAELTAITTSVSGNAFLIDTNNVTYGDLTRNDMDAMRDPNYQPLKDLKGMAGNLQRAMFTVAPGNPQTYINRVINGDIYANPPYNGLSTLDFDATTGPEGLHAFVLSTSIEPDAQARMEYLCYLTNYAATLYDAMYYYNDAVDINGIPYQSSQYLQYIDRLRRIVVSSTDIMYFIKIKYDYLSTHATDDNMARKYYWGLPKGEADLTEGSQDVFLPRYYLIQDRLLLCTAWGYGSLILRKDAQVRGDNVTVNKMNMYLGIVDSLLTESPLLNCPPYVTSNNPKTGLLDFHTSNSGAYLESPGYLNWVMLWSNQFFSTYARLGGINYFNNDYVKGWIRNTIEKTTPYKADWAIDDSNTYGYGYVRNNSNYDLINTINSVIAYCYYYTSDPGLRSDCSWYINSRIENGHYPGISEYNPFFNYCLLYLSDPSNLLSGTNSLPESYTNGSWTSNEFGVLRPQINSTDDLVDKPAIYITYQNSINWAHNHADQTSYSFFYRGKQFFIDPGYHNTACPDPDNNNWEFTRPWMQSPYAHNMIVVNPLETPEKNELDECYINYNPTHPYWITGRGNNDTKPYSYKPSCELKNVFPANALKCMILLHVKHILIRTEKQRYLRLI